MAAARRHGVPAHKVVPWVRRKLGPTVVVLRFRNDGSLGCSVPCVLCQRELTRFDLQVHCFLGAGASGHGGTADAGNGTGQWFSGRLSEPGAPTPVLTAGQRRTLNLDPLGRPTRKEGVGADGASPPPQQQKRGSGKAGKQKYGKRA